MRFNTSIEIPVFNDPNRKFAAYVNYSATNTKVEIREEGKIFKFRYLGRLDIRCCWPVHQGFNFKGIPSLHSLAKGEHKSKYYKVVAENLINSGNVSPTSNSLIDEWFHNEGIDNYKIIDSKTAKVLSSN